ncbi:hypothetical protein [Aestuariirhabdus sp. LZHN29]|uniref:hypothetical protein n=1 Tax=Aestuariirhabdus sp. LZHN29 TaxID=3417462 RepID=UPI003CED5EA3
MKKLTGFGLALCVLVLAGCASKATWEGMSEGDIAAWKDAGFSVEAAQMWRDEKFDQTAAEAWRDQGFEPEEAAKWSKEKFTAEEAGSWKAAEFELRDAIDNRSQGLTPIKAQ